VLTSTRLGLPLAQVTDVATSNYNLGVAGRRNGVISVDGVVRDTVNAFATLLDGATDFNYNEQIAGSWEFQGPVITDKGIGNLFVNNTGGARVAGDVVMMDPAVDSSVILPTAAGVSGAKIGVVAEGIASGSVGRVAFTGFIRVKCLGGVTRGQYLQTQNASVIASGSTFAAPGSFAIAATNPDGVPSVLVNLGTPADLESGGTINGNLTVTGVVTAASFSSAGGTSNGTLTISQVTCSNINVGGTVSAAALAGTLTTAAQGGITSLGALNGLVLVANQTISTPSGYLIIQPAADLYLRPQSGTIHIGDAPAAAVSMGAGLTITGALTGVTTLSASGVAGFSAGIAVSGAGSTFVGNTFITGEGAGNALVITGSDSTSSNFGLTVRNAAFAHMIDVRNDGGLNNSIVAWNITSTINVKSDLQPVKNGLDIIRSLQPYHYNRTDIELEHREFGLISEEVAIVLPQVVGFDVNGTAAGIKYENLISPIIAAIQELDIRVKNLE
jgi:Chaperone of endosialidase